MAKSKQTTQKETVYRSAISGRFVKKSYADKHKKTTEKEHYRKSR